MTAEQTNAAVIAAQQAFAALKLAQLDYIRAEQEFDAAFAKLAPHIYAIVPDHDTQARFDEILKN